jgi:F-type H+-transporting ATPase subunit delta
MKSSAAARRYARALFSLAREAERTQEVRSELDVLADLFEQSPELREALVAPLYPVKERRAVLVRISEREGLSPIVRNFYAFLIDQRRLVDFSGIREEFVRLVDEDAGVITAEVVSATALDERGRERLQRALSERTGYQVHLELEVDPELIGGVIAKVGDLCFDGSIRTQLEHLRANLTKGF